MPACQQEAGCQKDVNYATCFTRFILDMIKPSPILDNQHVVLQVQVHRCHIACVFVRTCVYVRSTPKKAIRIRSPASIGPTSLPANSPIDPTLSSISSRAEQFPAHNFTQRPCFLKLRQSCRIALSVLIFRTDNTHEETPLPLRDRKKETRASNDAGRTQSRQDRRQPLVNGGCA